MVHMDAEVVRKEGIYRFKCEIWRLCGYQSNGKGTQLGQVPSPGVLSSKNGSMNVQYWGMCRWIYWSGILVNGPSLGLRSDIHKLTNIGM
jgi:hypothetical protein